MNEQKNFKYLKCVYLVKGFAVFTIQLKKCYTNDNVQEILSHVA